VLPTGLAPFPSPALKFHPSLPAPLCKRTQASVCTCTDAPVAGAVQDSCGALCVFVLVLLGLLGELVVWMARTAALHLHLHLHLHPRSHLHWHLRLRCSALLCSALCLAAVLELRMHGARIAPRARTFYLAFHRFQASRRRVHRSPAGSNAPSRVLPSSLTISPYPHPHPHPHPSTPYPYPDPDPFFPSLCIPLNQQRQLAFDASCSAHPIIPILS
jgi:hypothetical protein